MPLSCGARALKFSLFVFNLVFLISGIICVGIGTWLVLDKYAVDSLSAATAKMKGYEEDDALRDLVTKPAALRHIGLALLVGGVVVMVVAFLGCCGAAKEWRPLLCCYASCLMVILATEIAAAIYAGMHSSMFTSDFRQILHASLKSYNGSDAFRGGSDDEIFIKQAWDNLMIEKKCCGVESKKGEFKESGWYKMQSGRPKMFDFPPACCPLTGRKELQPHCDSVARHSDGCSRVFESSFDKLKSHFKVVAWTIILIAMIQVFGIVVAFWLCDSISHDDDNLF